MRTIDKLTKIIEYIESKIELPAKTKTAYTTTFYVNEIPNTVDFDQEYIQSIDENNIEETIDASGILDMFSAEEEKHIDFNEHGATYLKKQPPHTDA